MNRFRLLVTKKISPSLVLWAGLKGVEILEKEFIRTTPLNNDQINKKINRIISEQQTVVFTSKNAVKAVASNREGASSAKWKIFCIEGATKEEVKKYFPYSIITGTAGNAGALAFSIIEKSDEKKIIFFCGNKRMNDMPSILQDHDFELEEIAVYKTEPSPEKIIDDYDAVAFFSPSAVESFFSLNALKDDSVCISVGNTTTAAIKKYTGNKIFTSDKPSEEDILNMVVQLNNKQ